MTKKLLILVAFFATPAIFALNNRSAQDTDQTDTSPSAYQAAAALGPTHANGRRLVSVIINSGFATAAGAAYATSQLNIGMGFAQFLLLPSGQYKNSGGSNNPWCRYRRST